MDPMTQQPTTRERWWTQVPPWLILGSALVLTPIFLFVTFQSISRQEEETTRLLLEKGAAMIRSFEAGARTGMRRMGWGGWQVQRLLEEMAQQPDVRYIRVVDEGGRILADSDASRIGTLLQNGMDLYRLAGVQDLEFKELEEQGVPVFEVFRQFRPMRPPPPRGGEPPPRGGESPPRGGGDWCRPHFEPGSSEGQGQVVFLGLDMSPALDARKREVTHAVLLTLTLLGIGLAGMLSLFLAQAYRSTRRSLSRVQAFSDHLVERLPLGLLALDAEERVLSLNDAARRIFRNDERTGHGEAIREILGPLFVEVLASLKEKGYVEEAWERRVEEGRPLSLEILGSALRDAQGALLGYVLLFKDMTEFRRLEKEVARSRHLASIGRLAAGVAHEIRNPLSSIKGFATYFKERHRGHPEEDRIAGIMIQEVDRLNRVIGQMLEFARPSVLEKKRMPLGPLIAHSMALMEGDAGKKGVHFHFVPPEDPCEAEVDADKILQALLNLYLNALEAMGAGGDISVALRPPGGGGPLQIIVSDTGPGIRSEDLPHVFDPYFTTKSTGTGLGLAIVHKIIESHGGSVRIESREGSGTRIVLSLPESGKEGVP